MEQVEYDKLVEQRTKNLKLKELNFHSTTSELYLEISTNDYSNILVKTSRLRDLLFHLTSFNVQLYYNNVQKGQILALVDNEKSKSPNQLNESLADLLIFSDEVFSYAYKYFPDVRIVKEWKKIHEQEKPKTIIKD